MLFRYRSRNTETQSRSSDVAYRICGTAAPWHYGPVALRPVPVHAGCGGMESRCVGQFIPVVEGCSLSLLKRVAVYPCCKGLQFIPVVEGCSLSLL